MLIALLVAKGRKPAIVCVIASAGLNSSGCNSKRPASILLKSRMSLINSSKVTRIALNVCDEPLLIGVQRTFELFSKQIRESDDGYAAECAIRDHTGEEFAF